VRIGVPELHPSRHTDAARIGQTFKPRGNVYPVTEYVAVLNNDIAHGDAQALTGAIMSRPLFRETPVWRSSWSVEFTSRLTDGVEASVCGCSI
jgi:hypothetical protein